MAQNTFENDRDEGDPRFDKHGRAVSNFVAEAIEALRNDGHSVKVICDHYKTGRLQYWSFKHRVHGDAINIAFEHGYRPAFVKTRIVDADDETLPYTSEDKRVGYMELIPEEHYEKPTDNCPLE